MIFRPYQYQHPSDRDSLIHLKAVKWFETVTKHLVAPELERDAYLLNVIDNIRMTRTDFPEVLGYVEKACRILAFHPVPTVFLDTHSEPIIQSVGEMQPMIVISSGLLDLLSGHELEAAIAHEVGHLASGHSYYKLLAQNFDALVQLGSTLPFGTLAVFAMKIPLYDWYRRADLTADRAAFLVTGKSIAVVDMIGKIAGGSVNLRTQISTSALLDQAREVEEALEQLKTAKLKDRTSFLFSSMVLQGMVRAQPWPAFRVAEIMRWEKEAGSLKLLG